MKWLCNDWVMVVVFAVVLSVNVHVALTAQDDAVDGIWAQSSEEKAPPTQVGKKNIEYVIFSEDNTIYWVPSDIETVVVWNDALNSNIYLPTLSEKLDGLRILIIRDDPNHMGCYVWCNKDSWIVDESAWMTNISLNGQHNYLLLQGCYEAHKWYVVGSSSSH